MTRSEGLVDHKFVIKLTVNDKSVLRLTESMHKQNIELT